jgi:hypothetical protein
MTDIIRIQGSREHKIAAAQRIKVAFETECPEMAVLRRQLIEHGMAADNLSSIVRVVTNTIDYTKTRDDPDYYRRQSAKPPIITEEIKHAIQTRTSKPAVPADFVPNSRGGRRRR